MAPRLSIVIIAKNEERYLPRLLQTIRSQDFDDYEVILSDARSTDRTRAIARQYGCTIVEGGLPSVGRNRGAKAGTGGLLLFLDADVALPQGFLRKNVAEFTRRKLDCATTAYKPISYRSIDRTLFTLANIWCKSAQYFLPHSGGFCIFCKRSLWQKTGGFPEDFLLAEDHEFVNRAMRAGGRFRVLAGKPIYVDVRRLEKEGRFNLVKKYVKGTVTRIIVKDKRAPAFDYVLQGHEKSVKELYAERTRSAGKRSDN